MRSIPETIITKINGFILYIIIRPSASPAQYLPLIKWKFPTRELKANNSCMPLITLLVNALLIGCVYNNMTAMLQVVNICVNMCQCIIYILSCIYIYVMYKHNNMTAM